MSNNNQGAIAPKNTVPTSGEPLNAATSESVSPTDELNIDTAIQETSCVSAASSSTPPPAETLGSGGAVKPLVAIGKYDAKLRDNLLKTVNEGYGVLLSVAEALQRFKTYKNGVLYKSLGYDTYEDFCRDQWGYQKSQAYRLADTGEFLAKLDELRSPSGKGRRSKGR